LYRLLDDGDATSSDRQGSINVEPSCNSNPHSRAQFYYQKRRVDDRPNPPQGRGSKAQSRAEGYADYRVGMWYVSPKCLKVNGRTWGGCQVEVTARDFQLRAAADRSAKNSGDGRETPLVILPSGSEEIDFSMEKIERNMKVHLRSNGRKRKAVNRIPSH